MLLDDTGLAEAFHKATLSRTIRPTPILGLAGGTRRPEALVYG